MATFKIPSNDILTIYNIDHHHDCGYHLKEEPLLKQELSCANWVAKIKEINLLDRYIWIKNTNSSLKPENF